jgi:hypothetical protein
MTIGKGGVEEVLGWGPGTVSDEIERAWSAGSSCGHHIIYAYMIENTRAFDVLQRVVHEARHGERLSPFVAAARWLRTTEALLMRSWGVPAVSAIISDVRPDLAATRRNLYYRMLGMDLNHGPGDKPFVKPDAANRDFVPSLEALLREVWRGIVNASNRVGPKEVDKVAIAEHVRRLQSMMLDRRLFDIRFEEFVIVALASWVHLSLHAQSPLVLELPARATNIEERLRRIGERVGVVPHGRSREHFHMAKRLSILLRLIEASYAMPGNPLGDSAGAALFYRRGSPLRALVEPIVTHWSNATGRSLKASVVAVDGPRAVPALAGGSRGSLRAYEREVG